ncbi:DUF4890 domain-containing protein [Gramella sp. KN1008]|uniref:DUF4890 domain-containing protein n=1 Tax=Gramella sp. KN1008 TaxID=2529298 RepID=UPI0013F14654|nr:DUF4890 domain-containing protein [Gramella sp. KN1008]
MKNLITLILLLFSVVTFAQERGERRSEMSDEEMAILGAKRLAMQLDLNEEQEAQLKELYTKRIGEQRELMQERREEREEIRKELQKERAKIREEHQEMSEEYKAELKKILTEEQYTKWEQLQEKRRKGRKMHMQKRRNQG